MEQQEQTTEERVAEIERRWAPLPRGPWFWSGTVPRKRKIGRSGYGRRLELVSRGPGGRILMNFVRWGMSGAQPRFQDFEKGLMRPASELVEFQEDYRDEISGIQDPTAIALQHAKEDVEFLLAELRRRGVGEAADATDEYATIGAVNWEKRRAQ